MAIKWLFLYINNLGALICIYIKHIMIQKRNSETEKNSASLFL